MAEAPSFFASVYALVAQIPPGFVASYGQLARMLGAPRAARQVGWAMRRCPDALPWQRVIREDGTIAGGEYAPLRRAMLEARASRSHRTAALPSTAAAGSLRKRADMGLQFR